MYVGNCMITDVITIFPDASLSLAFQMMVEKGYSQLPVVKDKKLVGLVTEKVLADFTPSKATTLSMYELNYALSKTNVEAIMIKDMATCTSDTLIEDAAAIFGKRSVDAVMVVSGTGILEGILTKSDILSAFIGLIGANEPGTSRVSIEASDRVGGMADITSTMKELNVNITHITDYYDKNDPSKCEIIARVSTLDTDSLVKSLEAKGFTVLSISKNQ